MIRVNFEPSPPILRAFERNGARIVESVVTRLNSLLIRLQMYILEQKLSGQVLARRSGELSRSIRVQAPNVEGPVIAGEVLGGGGKAWYGGVWENPETYAAGQWPNVGREIVPVNSRALSFILDGKQIIVRRVFQPPVGAKPFMSPALEEMRETIIAEIQRAFVEGAS